ncbi:hypothetical protein BH10PSE12_BH10PSE12_21090 [soil metagenome]
MSKKHDMRATIGYRPATGPFGVRPSETVGEGNMPLLISSLDGEKFFAGIALRCSGLPMFG